MKYFATLLFLVFGCIACSNQNELTHKEKEIDTQKENDRLIIKSGNIEYELHNTSILSKDQTMKLTDEIIDSTEIILNTVKTDYKPSEKIYVYLQNGQGISAGFRNNIKLFSVNEEKYPLVHELTHTLLGYGENFNSVAGYITQEGLGVYMQTEYGKPSFPNYGLSEHKLMKYLINSDRDIPLFKLIEDEYYSEIFRPSGGSPQDNALKWLSYIHAGSFVKYVIDEYGNEKFEKVYNKPNLTKKIKDTYGISIERLEKEWINYILESESDLTTEDKKMIDGFYLLSSHMKSIDEQIFMR
ncbi:hypothetical protein ACFFHH_16325 [Cytobacillus solani]|uniref:hypothetical protein n=1 Tax=Cytobacillus solani TaxID=1637975 RepID=UPI001151CDA2|nr:hypothetical protein [Cytobacillus solani]